MICSSALQHQVDSEQFMFQCESQDLTDIAQVLKQQRCSETRTDFDDRIDQFEVSRKPGSN